VTDEQRREAGRVDGQNDAGISGQALLVKPSRAEGKRRVSRLAFCFLSFDVVPSARVRRQT
jgi:hypothetical protein